MAANYASPIELTLAKSSCSNDKDSEYALMGYILSYKDINDDGYICTAAAAIRQKDCSYITNAGLSIDIGTLIEQQGYHLVSGTKSTYELEYME